MATGVSDACSIQCTMKIADDIKLTGHEISLSFYLFDSVGHKSWAGVLSRPCPQDNKCKICNEYGTCA
ncbi:hypothetical protein CGGC5_v006256 [Colletotrichum fructicola Nara gc5]|uniref:Uncharacterized protein n=1 Tax=Colletotrichum fructicola (strain Nara gc5) TaxID=1213859 RepID=A0A7J6JBM7_COLFN|nr:hypothetical protein CGGC5_v006256 [Colletotrichum fructicola Nara gc5]